MEGGGRKGGIQVSIRTPPLPPVWLRILFLFSEHLHQVPECGILYLATLRCQDNMIVG